MCRQYSCNPVDWDSAAVAEKILQVVEEYPGNTGVRIQTRPFAIGPVDHVSHRWIDGEETDEELSGISVLSTGDIDTLTRQARSYHGKHVAIIGGGLSEYGEDIGEIILKDAEVICILC